MSAEIAKHWWNGTAVPTWIVAALMPITLGLGTVVWSQQNARIARAEIVQSEILREQMDRTSKIAALQENAIHTNRMFEDVKRTQEKMLDELQNINKWLRGQRSGNP